MRGFVILRAGLIVQALGLLVLPLIQQLQLAPEGEYFLLLAGQGLVERLQGIFLECKLALQLNQLLLPLCSLRHAPPWWCNSPPRLNILLIASAEHAPMNKRRSADSRPVYSTEVGRLCPQCHRPVAGCVCGSAPGAAPPGDDVVRLRRETKGRGGKAVTVVTGLPLAGPELKELARTLKQKCGVGGAVKDGIIEIQGDQRTLLRSELEKKGYTVKIAGG